MAETASVMTLDENTSAYAMDGMRYYVYGYGASNTIPIPHGNCLSFSCDHPAVCNDGVGNDYGDRWHQGQTSYMNGVLNADIHRYIVVPKNHPQLSSLLGCVGVAIRSDGTYKFGVVGEAGPDKDNGIINEFSVKMIRDLGFNTDGANYVSPSDTITTYVFTDTKRSSWPSGSLDSEVETVGRTYYY